MKPRKTTLVYLYNEMVIQLGFVGLFAVVFPLAPLFSFGTNLLAMIVHLNDLAKYGRRNIAECSSGIGNWQSIVNFITFVATPVNFAVLLFARNLEGKNEVGSLQDLDNLPIDEQPAFFRYLMQRENDWWTRTNIVLFAVAIEHAILMFGDFIDMVIPDVPKKVGVIERNRKIFEAQAIHEIE